MLRAERLIATTELACLGRRGVAARIKCGERERQAAVEEETQKPGWRSAAGIGLPGAKLGSSELASAPELRAVKNPQARRPSTFAVRRLRFRRVLLGRLRSSFGLKRIRASSLLGRDILHVIRSQGVFLCRGCLGRGSGWSVAMKASIKDDDHRSDRAKGQCLATDRHRTRPSRHF